MNSAINDDRSLLKHEYAGFAKVLHWMVAACVLFMIPVGIIMGNLPQGDLQNSLYNLHRSFGVLVLALMLIRLAYRIIAGTPPAEPTLSAFQRVLSGFVHGTLYVLLIAQPILGWVATSAYGAAIWVFGLFQLPPVVEKNEALAEQLYAVHDIMGFTIAGLLVLHIGAALYHYFIRRDGVLQRMLP